MSTMIRFSNDDLTNTYLTEEQIKERCPAAFLTEGTNGVSDKYVVARTIDVVRDLAKLGWFPVEAKQRKPKKNSSGRFNYHMIFFQNPDIKITKNDEYSTIESYPRILLSNSMDGCSSFRFAVGCFRLVCSNGLVIATEKFSDMKIRHVNYTFEDLQKLINEAVEKLPEEIETMNRMNSIMLTPEQQKELAFKMFKVYAPDKEVSDETITEILTPTRDEDEGDSLWLTFNVIQEHLIKGQFSTTNKSGKTRKARPVKSFVRDIQLNIEFWKIAQDFVCRVLN